jgi:site-specific DNA-methyltransferase (adenine-specific)
MIRLIYGDCNKYLATCKNKQYSLGIVDPPYGIGVMSMNYTKSGAVRTHGHSAAKRKDYRKHSEWDLTPDKKYFDDLFKVTTNQIIWGGNYFSEMIPSSKSFICWDKRCMDSMTNDFSDCEYAWCSTGVSRMFRFVWNGMLQGNMSDKENRTHPTQKPVQLYKWLLKNYAKEGDTILDNHLGSGSSAIACIDGGFDFTGIELDPDYFEAMVKRVQNHVRQLDIFIERPEIKIISL